MASAGVPTGTFRAVGPLGLRADFCLKTRILWQTGGLDPYWHSSCGWVSGSGGSLLRLEVLGTISADLASTARKPWNDRDAVGRLPRDGQ